MKMIFKYSELDESVEGVLSRLKEMTLAHSVQPNSSMTALVDGSKTYLGMEEIQQYLDLLQQEQSSWYYCDC